MLYYSLEQQFVSKFAFCEALVELYFFEWQLHILGSASPTLVEAWSWVRPSDLYFNMGKQSDFGKAPINIDMKMIK